MGVILFIVIFCIVVVAHEFGHFIIAKANGIHVVEFSIGMGPTLLHFVKGDTKYSLKLLPIGGACMFEGEDGLKEMDETDKEDGDNDHKDQETREIKEDLGTLKKSGAFPDAPVWARIATVVAGPVFNFFLAYIFSAIIVASIGSDLPVIGTVGEGTAASEAGLMAGDEIVELNGKHIHLFREISLEAMLNEGEPVNIVYERDGQRTAVTLEPKYSEKDGRYYYGIAPLNGYTKFSLPGVAKYSFYEVKYWIDTTIRSLGMLVTGKAGIKDLSGPVGMVDAVDTIYTESKQDGAFYVWLNMLNFAILLSANLGVLNLIPFPALDGGRLLFLVIEAIRRKPIPPEKEGIFHFVGFALLMLLMVVVMYNDIARLVTGG